MVLVQNWPFFHLFFRQYRPGKWVLRYSRMKKRLSRLQKQEVQKVEKFHGFGAKLAIFQSFLGGGIIGQKNLFYDILERKNAFLGYKNSKFKKWKNCDFCKGVNPWFWSKIGHFSIFFLDNIGQENEFYDILEWKKRLSRL